MRIGISVGTYAPYKNGVQFVTQNLAEGLVRKGHTVTVLTRLAEGYENRQEINGVNVIRCNIRNKHMFHFGDKPGFHKQLIQLSQKVDVMIFVCLESVAADWALSILDKIPCQKILYMHGMHRFKWIKLDFENGKNLTLKILRDIRWGVFYTISRRKIGKFDKIIHLHEQDEAYQLFKKYYFEKNYVLENFAEPMFFERNENSYTKRDYFIYVANYHPGKNQMLLLEAFYCMQHNFKLILVGSEKNKYYDKLLEKKKLLDQKYNTNKNICFLYNISRVKLPDLLQNAYAFVMTSKSEHYPITIIEAMASGIPYISTNVGIVKFLPGGIIVSDNEREIAQSMDVFIEDKNQYEQLRAEAWQYANNNLTIDSYLTKFEQIILN